MSARNRSTPSRPARHLLALALYAALLAAAITALGFGRTCAYLAWALMALFFVFFVRHLGFAIAAARWVGNDLLSADIGMDTFAPTVAVLVACKDEELVVDHMVRALFHLDYPGESIQFVIVDDGSTDATATKLEYWADRDDRLRVLHRAPGSGGGKSGALNEALASVDAEILVIFDADHEPASDVIRRLVRHFRDETVDCVMGRCIIRNATESQLASIVFIDFLSGYLVNEYGRQALFELPAYGGANCAVRRTTVERLGGWNLATVTEDTDLTIRVILSGGRVRYDPTAVDFEEAVVSARRFWRQRYRWARGHQQCTRDYLIPTLRSTRLTIGEKTEFLMFLFIYHIPVLCGLGVVLTVLRLFGIGTAPAVALLPLTLLLFLGPLSELTVGMLLSHIERRAAWSILGFIPSFALSIVITTWAYFDGMIGRQYSWVKTSRSGAISMQAPPGGPTAGGAPADAARAGDVSAGRSASGKIAVTGLVVRSGGRTTAGAVGTKSFARPRSRR